MKTVLNRAALLLGVTCLVWVGVLWQWQRTRRDMSMEDIALYLGALPVAVIALLLMARWAWHGVAAKRAAQREAAAATRASGQGPSAVDAGVAAADEALRHLAWPVWLAAVNGPAGTSPGDLLHAAQAQAPRPALDAHLTSQDGVPVMVARITDLDVDSLRQPLAAIDEAVRARRQPRGEVSPPALDDHVLRALAALSPLLEQVTQALQPWAAAYEARAGQARSSLHVLLGLPGPWDEHERQVAEDWVRLRLSEPHVLPVPAHGWVLNTHHGGGETLLLEADEILAQHARRASPAMVLILAAHSDLSEVAVASLEASERLFHAARHPKGLMPSEAAAALLLASPAWPLHPPEGDGLSPAFLARLHRPSFTQRDKSIEASGKVGAQALCAAIDAAQATAQLQAAEVAALVCDGDQHSARGTELFGATLDLLPDLDVVEDVRQLGVVCGGTGAATPLLVVASACAQAAMLEQPVLAVCQGHPTARLALVARPAPASNPASGPALEHPGGTSAS